MSASCILEVARHERITLKRNDFQGQSDRQRAVEELARHRLAANCPNAYYFRELNFHCAAGVLTIQGPVPSCLLKKVVEVVLTGIEGVKQIDNRATVSGSAS